MQADHPLQADYRVQLDAFQGPLDLLLFLIRRAEVDVHDIPVAAITEQYLGYLAHIERVDIELAGEFLVMAATLMEIKSRMIAAVTDGADAAGAEKAAREAAPDEADPRFELVQQLLAYRRFREAADALSRRKDEWDRRFPARPTGVHAAELKAAMEAAGDDLDLEDLSLGDIIAAFEKIAASVNLDRLGEHEVVSDDTPIELHAADIVDRLRREQQTGGQLSLFNVLQGRTRAEMVGLLLAMLDLVRQHRLTFRQDQSRTGVGEGIVLELRDGAEEATSDETSVAEATGDGASA